MATKKTAVTGAVVRRLLLPGAGPVSTGRMPGLGKLIRSASGTPKQPTMPSAADRLARRTANKTAIATRKAAVAAARTTVKPPTPAQVAAREAALARKKALTGS